MIDKILEFALRQRVFVLLGAVALIAIGGWSAVQLPIDAVPDITNVQVQINTSVPALAPEEIEKLITYPIEVEMGGIEKLLEVRSLSKFGLSQVTLIFEEDADIYRARQLTGERLQAVLDELPPGVTPKLAPITTGLGEIYHYTVRYKKDFKDAPADPIERLRELKLAQDYVVKPALRTVKGVTEVNTSGGYERQVIVMPDPAKLVSTGLTVSEIADVIAENVSNAGGSVVEKGGEAVTVRSIGRVQTTEEIAELPLKFGGRATALRVKDVAEVGIGSGQRTGSATHDGEEAVLGSALMLIGKNSRLVSSRVHEKIIELRGKMPPGIEIETVYNRTDLVNSTIRTVEKNLLEGAILVIAVLIGLLGNWRAALIVACAIPLSMLFAMTGMVRYGVSGNLMSLGAVDFGLIVDGAVVMAENVVRMLAHRQHQLGRLLNREERLHTILAACKQVGTPTVFGVAIITIVYLPMFTLTGVEGKMFKPMAFTVVFALIGALILALTVVPVLCSFFMTKKVSEKDNFLIRFAKHVYAPVLHFGLRMRWLVMLIAVGIFALSIWVFSRLGAEFIPQLDEGSLAVQTIRTTSIALTPSIQMQNAAEKLLIEKFPEVTHTFARIGTSEVAVDPMGVNIGDTYILMKPPAEWRKIDGRTITKDELTNLMARELSTHFPGQSYLFSQPIELRFNELLSGSRADIAIKVFGDDYDTLEKVAGEVREIVEKIPGAADVEFDAAGKAPVLQVVLNRKAMSRFNVHAEEVNKVIGTAFAGHEAGVIVDGNRRYPIITRLSEAARRDFANVANLPVRTNEGGFISLGQVADISVTESVNTISREAFQRRMAIQVNLRGRDVQSFVQEAQQKIGAEVKLPAGYFVEYGGAFKNLQEARARLTIVVPMALALIFLLIFMAFHSVRQALIVYTGIPLAITGGIFALWVRDLPFSISAAVGFIALSGVAVLNGVMMISFINQLREEGKNVRDAVIEGAMTRLRPVLMTALVASLGFVPMALAHGSGAEVQRPLATVVIGGIITATFLTLVLLPSLYVWLERDGVGEKSAARRFAPSVSHS
ncbi:MAG: efflux RND transporter permease subunit [Opitutaceae bacterium]